MGAPSEKITYAEANVGEPCMWVFMHEQELNMRDIDELPRHLRSRRLKFWTSRADKAHDSDPPCRRLPVAPKAVRCRRTTPTLLIL